jgi:hypothetical protein
MKRPNIRDGTCCGHCKFFYDVANEGSGYCTEGVSRDPADWPDWCERDEDLEYNAFHLCELVADTEVCDAFKRSAD